MIVNQRRKPFYRWVLLRHRSRIDIDESNCPRTEMPTRPGIAHA
ncbi:hypothetical protein GCWU000342_01000 [Shuttleworthella satelles DSM 14600]|uniref:Uncharacterized protein n=1 Tax=Shuttleworthella satelles DSM 14600 TaxID=626523 RepID=C4GAP9_9FIRM|nr:hypothetical protein GCWU000342_01000 [Shuttleworthia satelles DSM 14600]